MLVDSVDLKERRCRVHNCDLVVVHDTKPLQSATVVVAVDVGFFQLVKRSDRPM